MSNDNDNMKLHFPPPPSASYGCGMIVVAILLVLMIAGSCGPKTNLHRDALDKLDRGEKLSPAEEKRIHDILYFKDKK